MADSDHAGLPPAHRLTLQLQSPPSSLAPAALAFRHSRKAVRVVALYEGFKGVLVLVLGFGLLAAAHHDLRARAEWLVSHAHLNPASHLPHIFIQAAGDPGNRHLLTLALGAALYAGVRLFESYGLWFEKRWAELLAAVSGAVYLPFEAAAMIRHPNGGHALLLVFNLAVVTLMLWALRQRRAIAAGLLQ